jgi:hypothetical protein
MAYRFRLAWVARQNRYRTIWVVEPAMQIVTWEGADAVVRVETRTDVIVAIPNALPPHDVLDLAGLVLSGREYHELRRRLQQRHAARRAPPGHSSRGHAPRSPRSPGTRGFLFA